MENKNLDTEPYLANTIFVDPALLKLITSRQIAVFIVWFILATLLVAVPFFSTKVKVKAGQTAVYTLLSPLEVEVTTAADNIATEKLRADRLKQVEDVYDVDPTITEKVKNKLQSFFLKIAQLKKMETTNPLRQKLLAGLEYSLSPHSLKIILDTDSTVLNVMESLISQTLDIVMTEGVLDKNALDVKIKINNEVSKMSLNVRYKEIIAEILFKAIENNKTLNVVATNFKKSQVLAGIVPVKTHLVKNQPIFYKGDTITPEHIEILKKIGLYGSLFDPLQLLVIALLNLITMFLLWGYLLKNKYPLLKNTRLLVLVMTCSLVLLLLARILVNVEPLYLPVVMITLIYTIVLSDQNLVFVLLLYSSVLATIIFQYNYFYFLLFIFNALFGAYFARRITQRSDLTAAAFYTALGTILVMLLLEVSSGHFILSSFLVDALKLIGVAIASAVMVIGLLPYIERYFNVVTSIKLLELSNPNMLLLRRLLIEAPGTYHHSIMVANLAEAAIEAVGGDSLLARVASYYHDIGKMKRPYFFVENQTGLENPHDKINLNLSVLIILSHVKDGVELAKKYQLPKPIIDIIEQHHGTSLVSYFYKDFLERKNQGKEEQFLTEENFKYNGPRPQTKEAAAIMIADACEAGIRALEKTTPIKVRTLLQKIIKEKFTSGQLDDSALTFKDLSRIEAAFMERLAGLFHSRISYPETSK